MLTPLASASANSRASAPGWSGIETKTERRRPHRPAVLARDGLGAGDARRPASPRAPPRSPPPTAAMTASSCARAPRSAGRAPGRRWPRRSARRATGSPAATRVTSRTPWPDSARWPDGASTRLPAARAASRCGTCEVRATAASCSTGLSRSGTAPATRASSSTRSTTAGSAVVVRRDRPRTSVEQRGGRRERTGPLAAGHRVAADVPLEAGGAGQLGQRAGLHAADVGDDGVAGVQGVRG